MQTRGQAATPQAVDAEFRRLTIQNYLAYPWFEIQRVAEGFVPYASFEGQVERPDRYSFFRPYVLIAFVLAILALLVKLVVARRHPLAVLPPLALGASLVIAPVPVLVLAQSGAVIAAGIRTAWRRGYHDVALLAVALFWAFTGLLAVTTAGISGFLLNRLYTQVEPARCLLIAAAASGVVFFLAPRGVGTARVRNLLTVMKAMPRAPAVTSVVQR